MMSKMTSQGPAGAGGRASRPRLPQFHDGGETNATPADQSIFRKSGHRFSARKCGQLKKLSRPAIIDRGARMNLREGPSDQ
jgi:hypothetical protein